MLKERWLLAYRTADEPHLSRAQVGKFESYIGACEIFITSEVGCREDALVFPTREAALRFRDEEEGLDENLEAVEWFDRDHYTSKDEAKRRWSERVSL